MAKTKGAITRLARDAITKAELTGILPHEILLDIARGNPQPIIECEGLSEPDEDGDCRPKLKITGWEMPDMEMRRSAASAAAPYYAPKISTVEVMGSLHEQELDELIASLASQAGVTLGADGEGKAGEEEEGEGGGTSAAPRIDSSGPGKYPSLRKRPVTGTRSKP